MGLTLTGLKQRTPRFSIVQMFMLTVLVAILLAMIVNARRQQPAQAFRDVCFSTDGSRLALCGEENTQIFDAATGTIVATVPVPIQHRAGPNSISFLDDGRFVIVGRRAFESKAGVYVCSFDGGKAELQRLCEVRSSQDSVAVAPTGYVYLDAQKNVLEFRSFGKLKTREPRTLFSTPVRKSDDHVGLSPNGESAALFSGFHQFRGPAMAGPVPSTDLIGLDGSTTTIAGPHSNAMFSPDGTKILLSSSQGGAQLHDLNTQNVLWSCDVGINSEESSFSADGNRVAILCKTETRVKQSLKRDQFVMVLDSETGEEQLRIDSCDRLDSAFSFSPNGKLLVLAEPDEYFRGAEIWDVSAAKQINRIGGSNRIPMLVLYPILLLLWAIAWVRLGRPPDTTADTQATLAGSKSNFRFWYAALTVSGLLTICFFSAICFFTMSANGIYGLLPFWNQSLAIVAVVSACLSGVWVMVRGIRRIATSSSL